MPLKKVRFIWIKCTLLKCYLKDCCLALLVVFGFSFSRDWHSWLMSNILKADKTTCSYISFKLVDQVCRRDLKSCYSHTCLNHQNSTICRSHCFGLIMVIRMSKKGLPLPITLVALYMWILEKMVLKYGCLLFCYQFLTKRVEWQLLTWINIQIG